MSEISHLRKFANLYATQKVTSVQRLKMKTSQSTTIILLLVLIQMTLSSNQIECEENVQCVWSSNTTCVIYVTPTHPTESCKFILNEPTNKAVTRLRLWLRNSEGCDNLPELSDTVSKFPNLNILVLGFMELKNIERARLTPFRRIKNLYLFRNEISQLNFDTFDDLRNLKVLHLQYNMIYDLHENLFNELRNLEELALNNNQLEIIPQGVFRSNGKLQRIYLQNNQIRRIDFQFDSLPRLESLNLEANVCINEKFNFKKIYDQSLLESVRYC